MAEYLVTGGTSFIASHVIKSLLESGHSVRTTVRDSDEAKVGFLWELKGAKEKLKIFEADLTVEGSFDDAVNGVDGVFHIASRVSVGSDNNNQEKLDPDLTGTMNVMNSCAKSSNTVKRIVLTSSSTTVRYRFDATQVSPLNESHWTDLDYCKRFNVSHKGPLCFISVRQNVLCLIDKCLNLHIATSPLLIDLIWHLLSLTQCKC